jgi:hypothetical protein
VLFIKLENTLFTFTRFFCIFLFFITLSFAAYLLTELYSQYRNTPELPEEPTVDIRWQQHKERFWDDFHQQDLDHNINTELKPKEKPAVIALLTEISHQHESSSSITPIIEQLLTFLLSNPQLSGLDTDKVSYIYEQYLNWFTTLADESDDADIYFFGLKQWLNDAFNDVDYRQIVYYRYPSLNCFDVENNAIDDLIFSYNWIYDETSSYFYVELENYELELEQHQNIFDKTLFALAVTVALFNLNIIVLILLRRTRFESE